MRRTIAIVILVCLAQVLTALFVFVSWAYGYEVWPNLNYPSFVVVTFVAFFCCVFYGLSDS